MKKLLLIVFVILKCYSMNGQNFNSSLFLGIDLLDPFDSLLIDTTFDVEYTLRTFPSNIVERRIQFGNNIKEYLGVPVEKLDLLVTEKEIHKVLYRKVNLIIYPSDSTIKVLSKVVFKKLGFAYQDLNKVEVFKSKLSKNINIELRGYREKNSKESLLINAFIFL